MNQQQDYIRDISEIRSMMERSSKFLSLSGWAGIVAGLYALAGAYIAYSQLNFSPGNIIENDYLGSNYGMNALPQLLLLGSVMVLLTMGTTIYLSNRKAVKRNEKLWNVTSRTLLLNITVPLVAGGLLVLILMAKGFIGLAAPLTLIFYGMALFIAGRYTFTDIKILGLANICFGLAGAYFIEYGLLFWALGFGVGHIVYGIFVHFKYDR